MKTPEEVALTILPPVGIPSIDMGYDKLRALIAETIQAERDAARIAALTEAAKLAEVAIRYHADFHGPSGAAWNISFILDAVVRPIKNLIDKEPTP